MNNFRCLRLFSALGFLLAIAHPVRAVSLYLTNADFEIPAGLGVGSEDGAAGYSVPGWTENEPSHPWEVDIYSPTPGEGSAQSGANVLKFIAYNATSYAEQVLTNTLQNGMRYTLSGWTCAPDAAGNGAKFMLYAGTNLLGVANVATSALNTWTNGALVYDAGISSLYAGQALKVRIMQGANNYRVFMDNVALDASPSPVIVLPQATNLSFESPSGLAEGAQDSGAGYSVPGWVEYEPSYPWEWSVYHPLSTEGGAHSGTNVLMGIAYGNYVEQVFTNRLENGKIYQMGAWVADPDGHSPENGVQLMLFAGTNLLVSGSHAPSAAQTWSQATVKYNAGTNNAYAGQSLKVRIMCYGSYRVMVDDVSLGLSQYIAPPGIFADNMVLQRGMPVPVWGVATPGQSVSVSFNGQTKTAMAGADGNWLVKLDSMVANTNSQQLTITITGVTNLTYTNVVVGDVWLASGQSNMYFPVNGNNPGGQSVTNAAAETAAANYPLIRHMRVSQTGSLTPLREATLDWSWTPCSPASVLNLSAAAYFFARTLFQSNSVQGIVVPIGILESSYGGTPLEAWVSPAALNAVPELKTFADQSFSNYSNGTQTSITFVPGAMFNAMISPLIPFALRGAIWYQGESGGGSSSMQYRVMFPTMILDWRSRWQQTDFPFYFVQLPSLTSATGWPYTREAQMLTLKTATNTGMAVIYDFGDPTEIHPIEKQDVGARLAALALNRNYGFTNVVPSGPLYRSYVIETNQVRIYFDYAESGLMTGQKNNLSPVQELVGVALQWFEIAGTNQVYVTANARIDTNNTVVVSAPSVPNPTLVRYAWSAVPMGTNLYNRTGLPASPFRIPAWTSSLPTTGIHLNSGGIQSTCAVPNNVTWWVESSDNLSGSVWTPLVLPQTGTGAVQTISEPINGHTQRFYRWNLFP